MVFLKWGPLYCTVVHDVTMEIFNLNTGPPGVITHFLNSCSGQPVSVVLYKRSTANDNKLDTPTVKPKLMFLWHLACRVTIVRSVCIRSVEVTQVVHVLQAVRPMLIETRCCKVLFLNYSKNICWRRYSRTAAMGKTGKDVCFLPSERDREILLSVFYIQAAK